MIGVAPPRIKQKGNLATLAHQNCGLLELTARLERQLLQSAVPAPISTGDLGRSGRFGSP
jgi:hypothetical protein